MARTTYSVGERFRPGPVILLWSLWLLSKVCFLFGTLMCIGGAFDSMPEPYSYQAEALTFGVCLFMLGLLFATAQHLVELARDTNARVIALDEFLQKRVRQNTYQSNGKQSPAPVRSGD